MLKCLIRPRAQTWWSAVNLIGENELLPASEWNNEAESSGTGEIVSGLVVVKLSSVTLIFRWNCSIFQWKSPMCIGRQFPNGVTGGESAFTLSCRRQSVGSGGSLAPSSTPSSTVASAATTSCWGSPFLGEACWPPRRQQTLLSSSAPGGGPRPQAPCWRQEERM